MMSDVNSIVRLRDMHPTRALGFCIQLTRREWIRLESEETIGLWTVFRSYILNGYDDANISVPARIKAVWGRCKAIIDKEAEI
jgi:hypothetical protein